MRKKALVIAYHFPPMAASSGIQRTLNFVRYLRNWGWESVVLSAAPRAYSRIETDQVREIPAGVRVERAFALDAARHLSIGGWYPGFVANPDRWASWLPFAVRLGRKLIRQESPSLIFSTYPIATAHLIGLSLAEWSGLPWIADFRDSMYDDGYPKGPRERAISIDLDCRVASQCSHAIFTTMAAREMYVARYPNLPQEHWSVIPNGFNEEDFRQFPIEPSRSAQRGSEPEIFLHSGTLYPVERNPLPFFRALRRLKSDSSLSPERLRIRLRATGHDDYYGKVIRDEGLQDMIELLDPLPYRAALKEMAEVDALLIFQAKGCNHQVPAKLYEYLRAQRPIIALVDADGDTAAVLRGASADNLLPLEDEHALVAQLPSVFDRLECGQLKIAEMGEVQRYSREHGAAQLAQIMNGVAGIH